MLETKLIYDLIKEPTFHTHISNFIKSYMFRPTLPAGQRYKRTPWDSFIDRNEFTPKDIINYFTLILIHESGLSRAQREAVTALCSEGLKWAYQEYLKKNQKTQENGKEENRSEDTNQERDTQEIRE